MIVLSVIVVALVAVAFEFVPTFGDGVVQVARDVARILDTGAFGGLGIDRNCAEIGNGGGPGAVIFLLRPNQSAGCGDAAAALPANPPQPSTP